ncbi:MULTISPECIES: thiamine-phosphate kinase [Candidatus Ichthyocystis]|uniref:thiamine-phosphate kinase n=1 Tax=Candidatus Ichthyocystis TaxID=2929841 RepID=UPI000AC10B3E|nr:MULTISPECIES: thiamine-phosphate kinase [Ichthyocystis]
MDLEEEIINIFRNNFPIANGIGDDSSIIPNGDNSYYLTTQDTLTESIHFSTKYYTPQDLAYKALAVNISDISAMGATPKYLWNSISFPKKKASYMLQWSNFFCEFCKDTNIEVMGGNVSKSPREIQIVITLIGVSESKYIKRINGAEDGDFILLCGNAGHAHVGLLSYENDISCNKSLEIYQKALKRPANRFAEGKWLAKRPQVHAMTDTSDGILPNLVRILKQSKKSSVIEQDWFPPSYSFAKVCENLGCDPETVQLTGGEDYGLIFCVSPDMVDNIVREFKQEFKYDLTTIGRITQNLEERIILKKHGSEKILPIDSFSHFS